MNTDNATDKMVSEELKDDLKATGVKEIAQNTEAMVASEGQEVKEAKPSFFVKRTARTSVELDVLTSKADGRIISVSKTGMGINFEKDFPFLTHTVLIFEFSIPNYEDISTYRQRSAVYRREAQQVVVDKLQLRNFLLVWHLKDWNMNNEDDKKIELTFDPNGSLSEESLSIIYSLSPVLIDIVMSCYEKDVLLA